MTDLRFHLAFSSLISFLLDSLAPFSGCLAGSLSFLSWADDSTPASKSASAPANPRQAIRFTDHQFVSLVIGESFFYKSPHNRVSGICPSYRVSREAS